MKLKCVAMLGDSYLQSNEVCLERVEERRTAWDEAEDDLTITSDILHTTDISDKERGRVKHFHGLNKGVLPFGFVKSKDSNLHCQFQLLLLLQISVSS